MVYHLQKSVTADGVGTISGTPPIRWRGRALTRRGIRSISSLPGTLTSFRHKDIRIGLFMLRKWSVKSCKRAVLCMVQPICILQNEAFKPLTRRYDAFDSMLTMKAEKDFGYPPGDIWRYRGIYQFHGGIFTSNAYQV